MLTVYKYVIPIEGYFTLNLPKNAEILTIQTQNGVPHIWAMVGPANDKEKRYFRLMGTGHSLDIEPDRIIKYMGTFQLADGVLVFHLFEIKGGK